MALGKYTLATVMLLAGLSLFLPRIRAPQAPAPASGASPIPARRPAVRFPSSGPARPQAASRPPEVPHAAQAQLLSDLARSSRGRWQVTWGARSVSRLYGARLPLRGSPTEAGGDFLARYGSLFGISPHDARLERVRSVEGNTQIIYSQEIDGLPVFGSRVSLVLDADNNLIYLSSVVFGGQAPAPDPVSLHVAARAAVAGLGDYSRRRLLADPGISLEEMQARARLGYRLMGNAIGLVYEFPVASREPPLDLEIYVDGMSGELADIRSLLKK